MDKPLRIGIIGDFDTNRRTHIATNEALKHTAKAMAESLDVVWLPTQPLEDKSNEKELKRFDALWSAPGSPYKSTSGALRAIQFCREQGWPFMGT